MQFAINSWQIVMERPSFASHCWGWIWRESRRPWAGIAAVLLLAGLLAAGCAKPPYAATTSTRPDPAEPAWKPVLSGRDQERAAEAMSAVADGQTPAARARPAAEGVRWSDVEIAVAYAADDAEMAVIGFERSPGLVQFRLKTVDDRPAWLEVRQVEPPVIYEAHARVGRFDDPAAAQRLIDALHKWMRRFGEKRQFED